MTYTATPSDGFWPTGTTNKNVENDATATSGGDQKSTSSTTWLSLLEKSGSYDAKTGLIRWTITLNNAHANLNGYTLSDILTGADGSTVEITGPVSVSPALGSQSTITLPYTFTADDYAAYTFTYTTTPDTAAIGSKSFHNTATLKKGTETHTADKGVTTRWTDTATNC